MTAIIAVPTFTMGMIDVLYREYDVAATFANGTTAPIAGIDAALLARGQKPTRSTVWTPTEYASGVAKVLLSGPHGDEPTAMDVPEVGAVLYLREKDTPEVYAKPVEFIAIDS